MKKDKETRVQIGDLVRSMPNKRLALLIQNAPLFVRYHPAVRYRKALEYLNNYITEGEATTCQKEFTSENLD